MRQLSVILAGEFRNLLQVLRDEGYRIIAPTVAQGAIVYDEISSMEDLPVGWADEQQPGNYRVAKRSDDAFFGYNTGPNSWKKYFHVPELRLWKATRTKEGFEVQQEEIEAPKLALVGVRSCELHAIAIQDRVLMQGPFVDESYQKRRENVLIVAINCTKAGNTCFCASMKTGPKSTNGFDLCLTEVCENKNHYFVVEVATERGETILKRIPHSPAQQEQIHKAGELVSHTADHMGRTMDTHDIRDLLYGDYDHPRWNEIAKRCLSCANCTMVCPTCFCTAVEDSTDLTGEHAERRRRWDSCFTTDFSYIHGGPVRASAKSRYRQWMTHKLASWNDQFGSSGCVGCGRCVTWCPVGIDITEELQAIRQPVHSQEEVYEHD